MDFFLVGGSKFRIGYYFEYVTCIHIHTCFNLKKKNHSADKFNMKYQNSSTIDIFK